MARQAAVVDTVVATVTTVAAALAVVATLAVTARVVGLIAHLAQADHATVAHQTPKNADGGSHRLI
jgi:hypothetical protein